MKLKSSRIKEIINEEVQLFLAERVDFAGKSYRQVAQAVRKRLSTGGQQYKGSVLKGLRTLPSNDPIRKAYRAWYKNRAEQKAMADGEKMRSAMDQAVGKATKVADTALGKPATSDKDVMVSTRPAGYGSRTPETMTSTASAHHGKSDVSPLNPTGDVEIAQATREKDPRVGQKFGSRPLVPDTSESEVDAALAQFYPDLVKKQKRLAKDDLPLSGKKMSRKATPKSASLKEQIESLIREALNEQKG
jgi:hypothetical protein